MAETLQINHNSFQQALAKHTLMGTTCRNCGRLFLPPRPMCPNCFSDDMVWTEVTGRGKLTAFTIIFITPTAMIDAGYGRENPYIAGVVQLDDGPAISAQILGMDPSASADIAIGTPMEAVFIERSAGNETQTFLGFQPVK